MTHETIKRQAIDRITKNIEEFKTLVNDNAEVDNAKFCLIVQTYAYIHGQLMAYRHTNTFTFEEEDSYKEMIDKIFDKATIKQ